MKPTVSDRITLRPPGSFSAAHGGIERREQQVLRQHLGFGQRVEQGRFAGVGVADQRHDRIRHALARAAMQAARAFHVFELLADLDDALADQAAVGFDLGFAGTAEEAEAAALALKMGPASDQPAALIGEMGELDLQAPFPRLRAFAEDFQDERGAIEHLRVPRLLQIALLHRAKAAR